MKHLVSILLVAGIVLIGGTGAALAHVRSPGLTNEQTQAFGHPVFTTSDTTCSLTVPGMNAWVNQPGYPLLPAYRYNVILPFASTIQSISIVYGTSTEYQIAQPLAIAQTPQPLNAEQTTPTIPASLPACYPEDTYSATIGAGLNGQTEVNYLTIVCYPVHYYQDHSIVSIASDVTVTITYQAPASPQKLGDEKDLLIIAPKKFESALQPLVTFKETKGVRTILKTVEDLEAAYSGRDAPEKLKIAIKDLHETLGVNYILLVGGLKNLIYDVPKDDVNQGSKWWFVPVRYTNLYQPGKEDPGYISDLYYADLYDSHGNFSSWDSNNNNIFAEWKGTTKDIIDLYPDVSLGRLACQSLSEVKTLVKKITTYESTSPSAKPWFSTMVVLGGDTFEDGLKIPEGEAETNKTLSYMTNFTPVKIWASNKDTGGLVPVPKDIISTFSKGEGFIHFAGHGSPERWNTYWPDAFDEERARGIYWYNIPFIHNGEKLPVIMVGGCHNSQFNVTTTGFIFKAHWVYGPIPECFSWLLVRNKHGGAIATFGNTGLGYGGSGNSGDMDGDGINDPDCCEVLGGYLEGQFFKSYGVNSIHILGDGWNAAITNYLNTYPGMSAPLDCKTVQEWALLGDPSLMIGGY
jgi:hypothetical protein